VTVRLVDCRPLDAYESGHVPGAVHLDPERNLTGEIGDVSRGRHPLPDTTAFVAAVSCAGIGADTFVLAYDDGDGWAQRLWWLLRHVGHDAAGTFTLSSYAGLLTTEAPAIETAPAFGLQVRDDDVIMAEEIRERLDDSRLVLVDARSQERWRGDVEPLDPVAGRIPGARNAFFEEPLPEGLLDAPELAVYCGSGVTACVVLQRLALAGRDDARLYPGSFSEWCRRDGYPIERGPA
jgi:thiosulfate/3-mercaptopyruvate sulfurtransferase